MATPLATTPQPRSYPLFYDPIANLSLRAWISFFLISLAVFLYPFLFSGHRAEVFKLGWADLVIVFFLGFQLLLHGSPIVFSYVLKARHVPIMAPEIHWQDFQISPEDSCFQVWMLRILLICMPLFLIFPQFFTGFIPLGLWLFACYMISHQFLEWLSLQRPRFAISEQGLRSDQPRMTRFYSWDSIDHAVWKQGTYCPRLFLHIREKPAQPLHPQAFYFNNITDQQRDELLTLLAAHIPVTRA